MTGKKSNLSFNISYCCISVALSVISMFAALVPAMTYALPAIAGIILWTINVQISRKWALLSYAACALLCLILVPEIEANLYFIAFFGFYPSIRDFIEKAKPKFLSYIIKLLLFNIMIVLAFQLLCLIISADKILDGLEDFGDYAVYVFWGTANFAFIVYDLCLNSIFYAFNKWVKPKLSRMIKR